MTESTPTFTSTHSRETWDKYQDRVEKLAGALAAPQRRDMLLEIRAHLLESMLRGEGDESQRLEQAIAQLGRPEEFVPGWVEERLSQAADPALMMRSRWQLLRLDATRGLLGLLRSIALGFGYMLVFYSFVMFILKILFPENVGLFVLPNGVPLVGYADAEGISELLGWWFLPISLLLGVVLFWWLNRRVHV